MLGEANLEGVVEKPFQARFERGRIVEISEGKDAERLKGFLNFSENGARTLAELGINSNQRIPRNLTGTRIDMAIAGHVHLGLGRKDYIGGNAGGLTHLDLLVREATLFLNEEMVLKDGKVYI